MRGWFVTFVLTESGRVEDAKFELFWCLIYAVRHGMGVNKLRNKKKNGEIEGETKERTTKVWVDDAELRATTFHCRLRQGRS